MRALVLSCLVASTLSACASTPAAAPAPAAPAPAPAASTAPAAPEAVSGGSMVSGADAKKLVAGGARLVDVRTPEEYAEKHIEGAENVPVDTVGDRDLGPKDAAIVVYCRGGKRAARAASTLRAKGYTHVYDLGAMSNWEK